MNSFRKVSFGTQKGFTLIELMIVVAIVGILAAVAMPSFQTYTAKSQASEAQLLAEGVKRDVALSYSIDATCPSNGTDAVGGISKATDISGKYVLSVTAAGTADASGAGGCTIVTTFRPSGVAAKIANKTFTWKLQAGAHQTAWECKTDLPAAIAPKGCEVTQVADANTTTKSTDAPKSGQDAGNAATKP